MNKSRNESTNHSYLWKRYSSSTGQLLSQQQVNQSIPNTLVEYITYENGYKAYNPCFHVRRKYVPYANYAVYQAQGYDTYTAYHNSLDVGLPLEPRLRIPTSALEGAVTGTDWAEFAKRGIAAMTPSMESGFGVSNFLYEMRELTSLFKWWDRGRSFFKNLSGGTLNYSFGLLPFIGDVQRLYKGMRTFDERLRRLKEGAGRLQVRHYTETLDGPCKTSEDALITHTNEGTSWPVDFRRSHNASLVTLTCTMKYTYQLPELDQEATRIRAFLDTIGAQLDLYTVWEAIPYSFVVDWFFNVGSYLKQFRTRWIPVTVYIKSLGVSGKWVCSWKLYEKRYRDTPLSRWVLRGEGEDKVFLRKPLEVEDRMFNLASDGDLTVRKFVLGSLLLEQRIRR